MITLSKMTYNKRAKNALFLYVGYDKDKWEPKRSGHCL